MYKFGKRSLSLFVKSECQRRLRLDLYMNDEARQKDGAPIRQVARPGLELIASEGRSFERKKFEELKVSFPTRMVCGAEIPPQRAKDGAFEEIRLEDRIAQMNAGSFVLESSFGIGATFRDAHGLKQSDDFFSRLRPDILHIQAADGKKRRIIHTDGRVATLSGKDSRLGIRIIDVKISAEPSTGHFAELAYYGMALAGWLEDHGLTERFVVLADAAIWPGKHELSNLHVAENKAAQNASTAAEADLLAALETDLETIVPEVVIARVIRFLRHDLDAVLSMPDWHDLPWHVNTTCSGCDYLGYSWKVEPETEDGLGGEENSVGCGRPLYCWQEAKKTGHLSRIFGLSRGATGKLRESSIDDLTELSTRRPEDKVFEGHQLLSTYRTLYPLRAQALIQGGAARLADRSGTSAILPKFSEINVYLTADYDVGSGLTFAFGNFFEVLIPRGWNTETNSFRYESAASRVLKDRTRIMLVDGKSLVAERNAFSDYLKFIAADVYEASEQISELKRQFRPDDETPDKATIQFYMWDGLTYDHLCRVVGRHLDQLRSIHFKADRKFTIDPMLWLIPSDRLVGEGEFVKADSPLTILARAIDTLVAADIPHHYGLLGLANKYQPVPKEGKEPFGFHVNKFYFDPLSDQMPSERGHELWNGTTPAPSRMDREKHRENIKSTIRMKLYAMAAIRQRLSTDLRGHLSANAPTVDKVLDHPPRINSCPEDSQIVFQHARLLEAAASLDNSLLMAMPPYQRESKFHSVRLTRKLLADEAANAIKHYGISPEHAGGAMVFEVSFRSTESRIKERDFGVSLMPETDLHRAGYKLKSLERSHPKLSDRYAYAGEAWKTLRRACEIDVLKFDRVQRIMIVRFKSEAVRYLVGRGEFDFDVDGRNGKFAIVDPFHQDHFLKKLKGALSSIGRPAVALEKPLFPDPMIARGKRPTSRSKPLETPTPATPFIWQADEMATASGRFGQSEVLEAIRVHSPEYSNLNPKQLEAISNAAIRRLSMIWGPPGTGKSKTAANLVVGLIGASLAAGQPVRIGITGPNWTAIDNVAKRLPEMFGIATMIGEQDFEPVRIARLCSTVDAATVEPSLHDFLISTRDESSKSDLLETLQDGQSSVVIAGTADQLWNLSEGSSLIDVLIVDEASQMDVAHAFTALASMSGGTETQVVVIGDDLQMPPVHSVAPPEGSEHLLGSIYDFYRYFRSADGKPTQHVVPTMLATNYRSNGPVVQFVREAGYGPDLVSHRPDARMVLSRPIAGVRPDEWPDALPWSPEFAKILDPKRPLVAVVHGDIYASQQNRDEADLVAGLVLSLRGRLASGGGKKVLSDAQLFEEGIGIVTPHRAQQSAIVQRLLSSLPDDFPVETIYRSVDTVERFQGQEKDVIIASFGIGDADIISSEEEFLFNLRRFNVIASRAKTKLVVVISRRLVDHLPRDKDALGDSKLLKHYVDGFLRGSEALSLHGFPGPCELRYNDR